eukprot:1158438-Pelagomonas_calceolata.AAC.6
MNEGSESKHLCCCCCPTASLSSDDVGVDSDVDSVIGGNAGESRAPYTLPTVLDDDEKNLRKFIGGGQQLRRREKSGFLSCRSMGFELEAKSVQSWSIFKHILGPAASRHQCNVADNNIADIKAERLPVLLLKEAAAAAAETVHRPVHTTTALPGGSSPALVAPPAQQAQQQPFLHGLGIVTFISSAQRQKRWIAHAVMLCHPRAQASRFQAVDSGPQDAGGAAGSSALEAGELGEASHEAGSASADQHRQAAELEQKACTAKLYSFMSFQAAPLRSASNAGFRKGAKCMQANGNMIQTSTFIDSWQQQQ